MTNNVRQILLFCVKGFREHVRALGCLMVLLFSFSNLQAQLLQEPLDITKYRPYPFVRFVDPQSQAIEELSDEEFLDKAGKVVFVVNRFDKFTNDSLLTLLEREVLNGDSLRLVRVVVRGAASPEGPFQNNRMLSRRRAQTLYDFLHARLSVPVQDGAFDIETESEDYRLLLAMMRRAGDRDADLVQRLCDRHLPKDEYTVLKGKLQMVHGGELWRRLLRDYFPQLRAARVVLFFEKAVMADGAYGKNGNTGTDGKYDSQGSHSSQDSHEKDTVAVDTLVRDTLPAVEERVPEVKVRIPRREILSIKTNLLFDVAYVPGYNRWCPIPNVAIEFYPKHGHFTIGGSFDFPWWQHYWKHKFFQVRNYQVEGRYYLRSGDIRKNPPGQGAAFRGLFFSAYANAAIYGICFNANKGWEGEALGGGLGLGWVQQLGKKGHWRLEFTAQVGVIYTGYDPYQFENPVNPAYTDHLYYYKWKGKAADFRERQYRLTWFGPTRVGVNLSYDILYRRNQKRGISFRPSEK